MADLDHHDGDATIMVASQPVRSGHAAPRHSMLLCPFRHCFNDYREDSDERRLSAILRRAPKYSYSSFFREIKYGFRDNHRSIFAAVLVHVHRSTNNSTRQPFYTSSICTPLNLCRSCTAQVFFAPPPDPAISTVDRSDVPVTQSLPHRCGPQRGQRNGRQRRAFGPRPDRLPVDRPAPGLVPLLLN